MEEGLVTLITPTGARPEAFNQCMYYMNRQTYKGPIQWIVVDDAEPRQPMPAKLGNNITIEYHRGPKLWTPKINTQRPNMDLALNHVKGEFIFVIEDDDWYHPSYLETFLWLMQRYDVVGEANNKYYAIKAKSYKEWSNLKHASLCSTGLKYSQLSILDEAINSGELFMDISFWRKCTEQQINAVLFMGLRLGVGIKQMPGRHGIGAGHNPEAQGFLSDMHMIVLEKWIGADVEYYKQMAAKQLVAK